ncbi:DUF6901 family protein [candidate division KSB1 bacterium]
MNNKDEKIWITRYIFTLKNEKKVFPVKIDKESFRIILPERDIIPEWADLEFSICKNCPLDKNTDPYCPAALSIIDVIEYFRDSVSWTEADISVETDNRSVFKHTSLQLGISSLIGIHVATSGCPVFGKLKPIALFHSPFASAKKVVFRTLSTYLLAQYYRKRKGKTPDWDLENLEKFYSEVHSVDKDFYIRLKKTGIIDASTNALNILDTYTNFVLFEIKNQALKDFEKLMSEYIDY